MVSRAKIKRLESNWGKPQPMNSLFMCKRGCDLKHAFNKSKRQDCKADCEQKYQDEAEELYPLPQSPQGSEGIPVNPQTAGFSLSTENIVLLLAAGGLLWYFKED